MSKAKPKATTKPVADEAQKVESVTEVVTEKKETVAEIAEAMHEAIVASAERTAKRVKEEPSLVITLTRDKEGRLVFEGEGIGKRIAGTDAVIPEVARQIGEEIANQRLI